MIMFCTCDQNSNLQIPSLINTNKQLNDSKRKKILLETEFFNLQNPHMFYNVIKSSYWALLNVDGSIYVLIREFEVQTCRQSVLIVI
jgi:hypothetical protein